MPTGVEDALSASLLERLDSLGSFNRQVAHDLRGPLVSVVCAAERARQALASGDVRMAEQMLHLLALQAGGLNELVSELLALAQAGEAPLHQSAVDLTELALGAVEQARFMAHADAGVAVTVAPLPTVQCTGPLLRQVFLNLVCNALKFSRHAEHPLIEIGWDSNSPDHALYVQDNGVGFDRHHAERLFEPFSRLHGSEYAGHGIGLSIVKRVVERHGGRVWAEPRTPRGAAFYFTLHGLP
jgi:signal transduction histidine kinase